MTSNPNIQKVALPAGDFERLFRQANVLTEGLTNAKSSRSKATQIGNFLAPHVGREVTINVHGHPATAKLCMCRGRSKQKLYYFEVRGVIPGKGCSSSPAQTDAELDDGLDATGGAGPVSGEKSDSINPRKDAEGSGNAEAW